MKQQTLNLVQITDSHLHASQEGTLLGMKTQYSFELVLDRVQTEQKKIDLILATGDIAQDGSVEAYQRFIEGIDRLQAPMRWTAGNHDNLTNMTVAAVGRESIGRPLYADEHWAIIMLDSTVPGKVHGQLGNDQLALLDRLLARYKDKHALITFHHHPLAMGSTWMDKIGIRNPDDLQAVLARHRNVRSVLWGHVHQCLDTTRDGVRYLSTPSTCVQFKPGSSDFSIDKQGPGYRWLKLHPNGRIDTGLSRVQGIDFEIDYSVKGY